MAVSFSILWFRDDLRLADNPALRAAADAGRPVLCVYCLDDGTPGRRPLGGAARWWLANSLRALDAELRRLGNRLTIMRGQEADLVARVANLPGAAAMFWNRRYGAHEIAVDRALKATLRANGLQVESHNGALLREPWELQTQSGGAFRVYTPFWRALRAAGDPAAPLPAPARLPAPEIATGAIETFTIAKLGLEPTRPNWAAEFARHWRPGAVGAKASLVDFLEIRSRHYADQRDRPDLPSTSGLSPHLRFGEISPRQVWHAARQSLAAGQTAGGERDIEKFLSELVWREFAYHLLHSHPDLATVNIQRRFDAFPWREQAPEFVAWTRGQTGYPIVDAGMRQLWRTGWMHNRVRMIVASFLVKHLLIDWRRGEQWFWDTLVDADPANNPAGWQWVAGCGADAAPYFRIFNPVLQGQKFDPEGAYVREFVPELARMPAELIHQPWRASAAQLAEAGVELGRDYAKPIVDHDRARAAALASLAALKPLDR